MISKNNIIKFHLPKIEENLESEFLDKIVLNTSNTWQEGRTDKEKKIDSLLGKTAEKVFESFVNIEKNQYFYIPYDNFRVDNYENHAPFDGLYVDKKTDSEIINKFKKEIGEIFSSNNQDGKLYNLKKIRSELIKNGIFIVEVKSTRLQKKYKTDGEINFELVKNHDFLSYPMHLRKTNQSNFNEQDYYKYCKDKKNIELDNIKKDEKDNTADLLIRVYIDEEKNIAYLIGYIKNTEFQIKKIMKKMIQHVKSDQAIYWSVPISEGQPILNLIKEYPNQSFKNKKKTLKY